MARKGEKKAFLMHYEFENSFVTLNDAEFREIIEGIFSYAKTKIIPKFSSRLLEALFLPIQQKMIEDMDAYEKTCMKRQESGSLGGRPKNQNKPKKPNGFNKTKSNQSEPKKPDNDSDYDYYSVCNNEDNLNETENDCHLGSEFKNESCFDCMKKKKCLLKESPKFLLRHPEGFNNWNETREKKMMEITRNRGKPPDLSDLEDFDWFKGDEVDD